MQIFRSLHALTPKQQGAVVAIGNFDGLHRGHQAILALTKKLADKQGKAAAILSFSPHPRLYFLPSAPAFQLTNWRCKAELLASYGMNFLYLQHFGPALVKTNAQDFIEHILIKQLKVSNIVVGQNFAFGHQRQGTIALLKEYHQFFSTTALEPFTDANGTICSSTTARRYLEEGQLDKLKDLLGRPWMIAGHVQHGRKQGRLLGFPTANLSVKDRLLPPYGIYTVRVKMNSNSAETIWQGVANLGIRPTFDEQEPLLEVHLFNFNQSLYGQRLYVQFHHFIRPEKKFSDLQKLSTQIAEDCQQALFLLKKIDN